MPMLRLLALPLLALAACATARDAPVAPSYWVMRHLQKEAGSSDPGLTAEGKANAERLAGLVAADPPKIVYVSTTRRARETAAPLAAKLRLTVKEYAPADLDGLVARVRAEVGPVLIVGHSNTVPEIVARLGGERPAPIAEESFGDVWHVWGSPPRTDKKRLGG